MKQDTLEEIVKEFEQKLESEVAEGGFFWSNGNLNPDRIKRWLRTTLTSYRNDVLEEAHDEIKKLNAYGDGQIAFKHLILKVIKSLKVDIIKR